MSANLATSSWTTGLCSQNQPMTTELMPPMRWAGSGFAWAGAPHRRIPPRRWRPRRRPFPSLFTASAARRSVHVAPSRCHRVEYLLMPKAMDFTSISMRVPPGSREWTSKSGLVVRTLSMVRTASRGGSAPPALQWSAAADAASRAFRCSSVRPRITAGAYSRCARGPARSDGLAVYPVAEAVVPSQGPCFPGRGELAV
jgi:hypothetical protein